MRVVTTIIILLLLAGCEPTYWLSGSVGKAIRKEVRDSRKAEINLNDIVSFEWDELYLYDPYTTRSFICKDLGISKEDCEKEIPDESTDDGEMYLVFRRAGKIVHKEMHIRFNGDFTPVDFAQPLTPENAVFKVIEEGFSSSGEPWFRLKLRSTQSFKPTPKSSAD